MSSCRCHRVRPAASARKSASSNTWTSGAPHGGRPGAVVSRREMLEALEEHYGPITPVDEESSAPADRFALPDGTVFGIISSTTEPFCDTLRS